MPSFASALCTWLRAGRPTGVVDDYDVLIEDQKVLVTTTVEEDGTAEFAPLDVVTSGFTADSGSIPAELLCDATVIAVRAYQSGPDPQHAGPFIAADWFTVVSPPCDD